LREVEEIFISRKFEKLESVISASRKQIALDDLSNKIENQIRRTRSEEYDSPKNTALYFSLLLETKDLVNALMNLLEEYYRSYNKK